MGFFDRWSKNDDGSYTDTQDDSGSDDSSGSSDSSDSDNNSPTDQSNPRAGLSGGGGVDEISDDSGSGSGSSASDDDTGPFGGDSPPDPMDDVGLDDDNPFDDGDGSSGGGSSDDSSGSSDSSDSSSSGSSSSDGDDSSSGSTRPDSSVPNNLSGESSGGNSSDSNNRQSGSGVGPSGVSGSEAATPDSETDTSQNDSTEDIEATRTGKLEDTASDPQVREQAQSLEDDVAGRQVTDVVDGLKTTGAELREEDVEVVRDGDKLKAELSPVGRERVQNIADRQQDEQAERAVEQELNTSFTNEDVSVNDDGSVDVSDDVQREATEQAIAESNPGVRESDVTFEDGEPQVQQPGQSGRAGQSGQPNVQQPQDRLNGDGVNESGPSGSGSPFGGAAAFEEETGLNQGEDFTVQRKNGNVSVNVTQRGAQELRGRREQDQGDALTPLVEDVEGVTGVDLPGGTSEAGEARVKQANDESQELFGGRGEVEQGLRNAAEGFDTEIVDPLAEGAGDVAAVRQGDSNPLSEYTTAEQQADIESSGMSRAEAEGVVQGAGGLANLPQLGVTAIEAGEVARAGISETAVAGGSEQGFEEFEADLAGATAQRGADIAQQADENPGQLTGQLVGGTAASTGLLAAGRRVGGQTGARAAGSVVQPGEEVLKTLRRTDTPDTSASAASSGGTQLGSGGTGTLLDADALDDGRGPSTRSRVRGRIERSETINRVRNQFDEFVDDTSAQQQLTARQRGGSSSGGQTPDAPRDFDPSRSEVLEGSPRDQLSSDVADRTRTQLQQTSGAYDGGRRSDTGRTRAETENAQRLRERAQRSEVQQPARTPDGIETTRRTELDYSTGLLGGLTGAATSQSAVEQPTVTPTSGIRDTPATGSGLDSGLRSVPGASLRSDLDTEVGLESGLRESTAVDTRTTVGTESRTRIDERTESRQDIRAESRTNTQTAVETGTRIDLGLESRFETDFPDSPEPGRVSNQYDPDFAEVEFQNAVATPSEVLGVGSFDSTEDFGGFDEDEFDTSGGLF
ncbi:hypothetical protein ACOJIV_17835 [Haloarcula sp. AONF1]